MSPCTTHKRFLKTPESTTSLGKLIPVPDHCLGEVFPNVQHESPLVQLETILSSPIASYMEEEANLHLTTTSYFYHCLASGHCSPDWEALGMYWGTGGG